MEKFFEYFDIPKIEYSEPGRCYDNDGELCEWYISKEYPSVEPVFFELLNYYYANLHGAELPKTEVTYKALVDVVLSAIITNVQDLETQGCDIADEKADIREIFTDYYGE